MLVLVCLLAGQAPAALAGELPAATAMQLSGDDSQTRFVAELSAPVGYSVYVLSSPYRVVIDLPQVDFALPVSSGQAPHGLVRAYRFGPVDQGRARIVLDTEGPALIGQAAILPGAEGQSARLVVDLVRVGEEAFAARLKAAGDDPGAMPLAPPVSDAAAATPVGEGRKRVVIDPGHGGIDPGAIGVSKTREKDVVLAFGLKLKRILEESGAVDVVMTRSDDRFLSLKERVQVARDNKADLFIAIHADIVRGQAARGATIYTLSEKASDAEAEALAHKENRADIIAGIDLEAENEDVTDILIELTQRESKIHSLVFAKKAVASMKTVTTFTGKPMRSAGFVVLKAPDVPSVLVELGYLSSREDERQLTSPAWQEKVAAAMARAVESYFAQQLAAKSAQDLATAGP
ncbi:N-acetylmuramoyl-L-alanine amidase [Aestuariivirga sp.]|uniref:N-acetylmuramoyl-L-alanine amidase n=1 Tax=Aestuariivirga sp. TaxID=2650926 RepID=UPI00378314A5